MKKSILFGLGLSLLSTVKAQVYTSEPQWLEDVIVEKYYVSTAADSAKSDGKLPVGSVAYRVFADMLPGAKLLYLFGEAGGNSFANDHPLIIKTSTTFFNHEGDGDITPAYNATNAMDNTLMLDSWFSPGSACSGYWGVTKTEDDGVENIAAKNVDGLLKNTDPSMGIPLTEQDGMIAIKAGENIQALDLAPGMDLSIFKDQSGKGGVFNSLEASIGAVLGVSGPTGSNRVLIGQFTTDGKFEFELNLAILTPMGHAVRYTATKDIFSAFQTIYDLQAYLPCLKYPRTFDVNDEAPTVKIKTPVNHTKYKVSDKITIDIEAADADGQIKSVFIPDADGNPLVSDSTLPYQITVDAIQLGLGYYNLTAIAVDDKGNQTTSEPVQILISNDKNTNPYVTISSPPHFSIHPLNTAIPLVAEAYDADTTIHFVEFFKKNTAGIKESIGKDSIAPYTVDYTSDADTNIVFSVKVTDNRGQTGDYDGHILFFSSNTAPVVAVTIPSEAAKIDQFTDTTITVNATDNEKVALVEFFLDGKKIGEDGLAPFELMWKAGPVGMHQITAVATDNKGMKATSAVVNIEVEKGTSIANYTKDKNNIILYPNPVKDFLTFEFNSGKSGNYYLYNTSGQLLQSGKLTNGAGKSTEKINMTDYTSGNYILELIIDDKQSSGIVIKQ